LDRNQDRRADPARPATPHNPATSFTIVPSGRGSNAAVARDTMAKPISGSPVRQKYGAKRVRSPKEAADIVREKLAAARLRAAAAGQPADAADAATPAAVLDATGRRPAELKRRLRGLRALSWYVKEKAEARQLPALMRTLRAAPAARGGVQFIAYGPGLDPAAMESIARAGGIYHVLDAFGPRRPASGAELARLVEQDLAGLPTAAAAPVAGPAPAFGRGVPPDRRCATRDGSAWLA
jgi:hypothetical protein